MSNHSEFRSVWPSDVDEERAFAEKAAREFAEDPELYSTGRIAPGEFIALRWGLGQDCVLVMKLDESHTPTNYMELVNRFKERKEAE